MTRTHESHHGTLGKQPLKSPDLFLSQGQSCQRNAPASLLVSNEQHRGQSWEHSVHMSLGGPQSEQPPGYGYSRGWPLSLVDELPWAQLLARNHGNRGITSQGQVIHEEKMRNKVIPWRFLLGGSRRRMTKTIQKNILAFLLHLTENQKKPGPVVEILSLKVQIWPRWTESLSFGVTQAWVLVPTLSLKLAV